ncbi:iron ABC transporter permease [Pseudovibrio sp. Tun.PSC04-5.I4]|uniref:FecCD family ABC transporter permease n=1 Tax=Pseudovibrio sp. Tun.PSC04-5.I4 TaxID=1798213 RepID=UPI00088B06CB|nr:iron ABC transporter permease [Pseudovibrio sp. Tun.PSC04-5.I4]SDQ86387.1 iron complex transport system permease protein [Pseudovibrio sp. Tun.PSC04-5.I4]
MSMIAGTSAPQWRVDLRAHRSTKTFRIQLLLLFMCICAGLLSLGLGAVHISLDVILNTLFGLEGDKQTYIIWKSRLPRTLIAFLAGASLAVSGVIVQAIIRNPLASPKIMGINSGAALAALGSVMFLPEMPVTYLPVAAALGGIVAAVIVLFSAHVRQVSPARLALVGIAVGMVCDAGVDYLLVTAATLEISNPLVWLTGSLWARTWVHVQSMWIPLLTLMGITMTLSYQLDLQQLGDQTAQGLGQNTGKMRVLLLGVATLLASISVGVVGVIGFIGLISPHISRSLVGGQHRILLPTAALVGALLVVVADAVGRAVAPPIEVSAGILSAMLGAPYFIWIMSRSEKGQSV